MLFWQTVNFGRLPMLLTQSFSYQFDDLLTRICSKLQISPTQHQLAETRYHAIGEWLSADGSRLAKYNPQIYAQGSLRIGTTVKPLFAQEYDLDLVCEIHVDPLLFPNPVELLNLVEGRLREHQIYNEMIERKNRCIRINYAGDFHLDILPACPDTASGATCVVVPDREARCWKHSNPKGFASWFDATAAEVRPEFKRFAEPLPEQVAAEDMVVLKLVVQLLKRDVHYYQEVFNRLLRDLKGHQRMNLIVSSQPCALHYAICVLHSLDRQGEDFTNRYCY
jgi:hypothetical protein